MVTLRREENNYICRCCSRHIPLPINLYYYSPGIYLCPTAHDNLLSLRLEYKMHNGRPPGHIRKHFSDYIQNLVQSEYDRENF